MIAKNLKRWIPVWLLLAGIAATALSITLSEREVLIVEPGTMEIIPCSELSSLRFDGSACISVARVSAELVGEGDGSVEMANVSMPLLILPPGKYKIDLKTDNFELKLSGELIDGAEMIPVVRGDWDLLIHAEGGLSILDISDLEYVDARVLERDGKIEVGCGEDSSVIVAAGVDDPVSVTIWRDPWFKSLLFAVGVVSTVLGFVLIGRGSVDLWKRRDDGEGAV